MVIVVGQGPPETGPTVATVGLTSKVWLLEGFAQSMSCSSATQFHSHYPYQRTFRCHGVAKHPH